jgi:hypothetical protein
MQLDSVRL